MKTSIHLLKWLACMAVGLALVVGGGPRSAYGAEDPAPGADSQLALERAPAAENAPEAAPAEEPPRRPRAQELVSVLGDAKLGPNQRASEVVVVRGDAAIDGEVVGDLVVIMGKLTMTGSVGGDVVVVLGEANINGPVKGDTVLVLTEGTFGPKAHTHGDVMAVGIAPNVDSSARLEHSPETVALGPLTEFFRGFKDYFFRGILLGRPFPPSVGWVWGVAGLFLVFHLLLAVVLAQPLRACMTTLREQPARSFLIGLLTCILVGPVSILLSFTVVAPLLIWLAFVAFCVFGRVAVYGAAGMAVGRASGAGGLQHPLPAVLVGSVLFYLSYMIPFVGFLVYGLVVPLGLGAVLIRLFEAMRRERGSRGGMNAVPAPGAGSVATAATALVGGSPGPATQSFVPPTVPPPSTTLAEPEAGGGGGSGAVPPVGPPPGLSAEPPPAFAFSGAQAAALARVGFWPRFGATLIDLVLIGVVNAMTFQEVRAFWILLAIYHVAMWAWKSTTLGGAILNLRVVRIDGRVMDWQTAIVRALGAVVSLIPLGLGFFWASWDPECQSWHDRIAGTTIVRLERRVALV
jgi:uncharacterized RDD family membrane protein YckC